MNKNKPLVSIITPCFNSGKYLRECIESVLAQDYPYVEHVIQDGGSTDETLKILKKYSGPKYKNRIRWVSEKDTGQADGLNKAIQRCRGDILLVLNADDSLLPYACSWAVAHFSIFPKMAVIYGDVFIIDEWGKILKIGYGGEYDYQKLFCVELVPPAQAAFIQRSYFERVGFWADAILDTCPDFEMWVRIGLRFPMMHIPGIIARYRAYDHPDSHAPRSAERFFNAKRLVISRVLNDPKTPKEIRQLKRRAYGGLSLWAAHQAMGLNEFSFGFRLYLQALLVYPSEYTLRMTINIFLDSPLQFIRSAFSLLKHGL